MRTSLYFKFLFISFLLALLSFRQTVNAQGQYGNEWINYSQTYYKIKVAATGLYKLDYDYLRSLGLANVNPQHFQLYRRGKEVAIRVAGESDGRLDAQDYIEFFGEKNDGVLDSELYKNPAHQIHQLRSLYTDTAVYFLTYAPTGGKRMREVNPSAEGKTPEPYHLQKATYINTDRYNRGKLYGENRMPWMDQGEGFVSNYSLFSRNYSISGIINMEPIGPKPIVEFATVGVTQVDHTVDINVVLSGGSTRKLKTYQYDYFAHVVDKQEIGFSDVIGGKVTLQVAPVSTPVTPNSISFSYGILTYPQKPIISSNNQFIYTDSTRSVSPYYELTGVASTTVAYDVTNQEDIVRMEGFAVGTKRGYVVKAEDGKSHKILLANTASPLKPEAAKIITFRHIEPAAHNYIVLTNKRLMQKVGDNALPAPQAYAAFRASELGGSYDTLLVFIDNIVNQFHYGEHSANAIRRFLSFMGTAPNPKQMFIIGKGVEFDQVNYRLASGAALDLVPTGGIPGSDVFFSADFRNNSFVPKIPTGRLSATSAKQVMDYLDKVKEYEAQPQGVAWRKNILQLGGGGSLSEINDIASYMKSYEDIASGPFLGANIIEKYRKNVSETVEVINVSEEINAGVSLVTFFGHSSTSTTDLDIGYVSKDVNGYRNKGKYPVMLMNGCNLGNTFVPNFISFGENWVLTPDKGAVAYIANTDYGYPSFLHLYTANFYTASFQNAATYGSPIGIIQKEVIQKVKEASSRDETTSMVMAMSLQGDPAIRLYSPDKPDYYIKDDSFSIHNEDESVVTAASPKFTLKVGVGNLGKVTTEPVKVTVKRTLADQATVISYQPFEVNLIQSHDVINLEIDNEDTDALGMNSFEVTLDGLSEVEELDESNNTKKFQHYFPANGLRALSPSKYGIVNSGSVKLVAQPTQSEITSAEYYFELDTTSAFNSNLKQTYTTGKLFMPTWEVTLPDNSSDSTVYFWRARFKTYEAEEDTIWAESSFRYIPNGKTGWSQSHYGQFNEVQTSKISNKGEKNIKWEFEPLHSEITIRTAGGNVRYVDASYGLFINGRPMLEEWCGNPAGSATPRIYLVVIDPVSLTAVKDIFSAGACSYLPELYEFGSMNTAANRTKLENFLKAVPEGYYVAAIGINAVPYGSFSRELKNAFKNIGSALIDNLQNGYPFAIVGQKGSAPGTAEELTASLDDERSPLSQDIALHTVLSSNHGSGTITSTVIGPALSWETLHYNVDNYQEGNDEHKLSVVGINEAGQQEVLVEEVSSKIFNLSAINATQYPKLQLSLSLSDETDRTAPQLKEWFVYYEEAPEGVIRPDLVKVSQEILTEEAGKGVVTVPMAFENISGTAFSDSLQVEVTLTGTGIEPRVASFRIEPLTANKTTFFNYRLLTNELEGDYKLSMYVNPMIQQEQEYFNNIYEVPFSVKATLHPILDVAFDGVHIMDGELVSPSPIISIMLKDENKGVYLQDPSTMSVIMIDPQGNGQEVNLTSNPNVRFYPADEKNDFRLEYVPEKLEDGLYTLEVKARDVKGRLSGISPYRISFEVVNESTITNFYPFPNPFSTKTNFIFTLTGATIPDNFKIQILTVTGKVVKEIMMEEIGPIRIGNNKSDYAWDGTDMYGDKLANGVYLYRVVMSEQGVEDMKHRNTFGDKAFKNGYGKLYILR